MGSSYSVGNGDKTVWDGYLCELKMLTMQIEASGTRKQAANIGHPV